MKRLFKLLLASNCLLAASINPVSAYSPWPWLTFDENGNGYEDGILGQPTPSPVPGLLRPDPSGGIIGIPVLVYSLPSDGYYNYTQNGDVALVNPNFGGSVSQLLRFYYGQLIIYANDGYGLPADTGLPAFTNAVQLTNNGFAGTVWLPADGQPGALVGIALPIGARAAYEFVCELPLFVTPPSGGTGTLACWLSQTNLVISWSTNLTSCSLYQTTNLAQANWTPVTNSVATSGTNNQVTIPMTPSGAAFFRLQSQ
jgi:hypothetical protein